LKFLEQNASISLPNIIISDIVMPGLNGYELCTEVKKLYPEICLIMVTGSDDTAFLQKSFDAGAIDYIKKTSSKTELFLRIKNVLRIQKAELKLQSLMDNLMLKNDSLTLSKSAKSDNLTGLLNRDTFFKKSSLNL